MPACTGGNRCPRVIAKGLMPLPVIRQMITGWQAHTRLNRPEKSAQRDRGTLTVQKVVDGGRIELPTSALRTRRSPS